MSVHQQTVRQTLDAARQWLANVKGEESVVDAAMVAKSMLEGVLCTPFATLHDRIEALQQLGAYQKLEVYLEPWASPYSFFAAAAILEPTPHNLLMAVAAALDCFKVRDVPARLIARAILQSIPHESALSEADRELRISLEKELSAYPTP